MTCDDDDLREMNGLPLTDAEIDGILDGRPSGDAALDAALSALREVGTGQAPLPSAELRRVLGAGPVAVASSPPRSRRRGRTVATGSATVAGILLASATAAAAAVGVHHLAKAPAHTAPVRPATPAVTRTLPGPVVLPPAGPDPDPSATHGSSRGLGTGEPADAARPTRAPASSAPDQDAAGNGSGKGDDDSTPRSTPRTTPTDEGTGTDDGANAGSGEVSGDQSGDQGSDGGSSGGQPPHD
jgi:hypothetical protein